MNDGNWAQTEVAVEASKIGQRRGAGYLRAALGLGLGIAMVACVAGCHKTAQPNDATVDQNGADPADANMASASGNPPAQVLAQNVQYQGQQQGEDYGPQQAAPIERAGPAQNYNGQGYDDGQLSDQQAQDLYNADLTDAEASEPPPPLPEYDQPPAPDPNYLWTPGYWAWGPGGYYWVPGAWVEAPYAGALWTPGYWGYVGNVYRFHHGFWGLHVGFYGGIDYGFGYVGYGYYGGYWNGGQFFYNTAINRVNVNVIHNVYSHNVVINNRPVGGSITNRVSFNGGRGGIQAQPRPAEVAVLREQRNAPMASQVQAQRQAAQNTQQLYSANHGRPAVAVAATAIGADRTRPAVLPRPAVPAGQPGTRGEVRPGQPQGLATGVHPQAQQQQVRTAPEARPVPQANQVPAQQNRPGVAQPEARPVAPQQQVRQAEPQGRQAPQPRPEAAARPQPQAAARPEAAPHPQPQARPAPAPHAAPAAHPEPPHGDDKQHP